MSGDQGPAHAEFLASCRIAGSVYSALWRSRPITMSGGSRRRKPGGWVLPGSRRLLFWALGLVGRAARMTRNARIILIGLVIVATVALLAARFYGYLAQGTAAIIIELAAAYTCLFLWMRHISRSDKPSRSLE
jgi:hypothetical protein